jgi:hypothetical protein
MLLIDTRESVGAQLLKAVKSQLRIDRQRNASDSNEPRRGADEFGPSSSLIETPAARLDESFEPSFRSALGQMFVGDCLQVVRTLPSDSVDLVVTSPPYDGQSKYGNGERYDREWYAGFFLDVTKEIHRILKPSGSFVLNYRSKRHGDERGTLQFELIFWLRNQGFLF